MSVTGNILRIRQDISSICKKLKRNPAEIELIAVIKETDIAQIKEAADSGISDFGGNKIQDTITKYRALSQNSCSAARLRWHMIGHLQTNKVKDAVKIFDLIHSVDSLHLAEEIDKQAKKINKIQNILIEINVSGEPTKYGISEDEALDLVQGILPLKNLCLEGLMAIAPLSDNPESSRKYFKALRVLKDKINANLYSSEELQLKTLSMGMTQDYNVAIEEGATAVRIGRGIFKNEKK